MAKRYQALTDEMADWIAQQHIFFVASAPLSTAGHVNCSPKGGDSFRIIDSSTVAYQDMTGSGAETIAHLRENGRIVVMFCGFEGRPKIIRLHGNGQVILEDHAEYAALSRRFPQRLGQRAIIRIHLTRISTSCGFGVPTYNFVAQRDALDSWAASKDSVQLDAYRREKNAKSIDGLAALEHSD